MNFIIVFKEREVIVIVGRTKDFEKMQLSPLDQMMMRRANSAKSNFKFAVAGAILMSGVVLGQVITGKISPAADTGHGDAKQVQTTSTPAGPR
mgnify:CR=1 FL=1